MHLFERITRKKKKHFSSATTEKFEKKMKAKPPSNGPLSTPLHFPCPPRPKNQIFTSENRPLYNRNFWTIFFSSFGVCSDDWKKKKKKTKNEKTKKKGTTKDKKKLEKQKKETEKKKRKKKQKTHESEVTLKWATSCPPRPKNPMFPKENSPSYNRNFSTTEKRKKRRKRR